MDDAARLAALARRAADEVEPGMTLGLGSGSTAEAVVRELGARVAAGLAVSGVPSSERTATLARQLGIPLQALGDVARLDLGIDGADEIDPRLDLVKGRGGAFLWEKLVALACDRYVIVAAAEKLVERLGSRAPLPVEVIPFGRRQTAARLEALGLRPSLRVRPDASRDANAPGGEPVPFVTDSGNHVLDCAVGPITDVPALATAIKAVPGVVEHGLFVGFAQRVLVVDADGTVRALDRGAGQAGR